MPKEVVVNAWCDPCFAEGEHEPAEEYTLGFADLARMRPRTLLLCERHRKEVYEPLRNLVEEFGATAGSELPGPVKKSRQRGPRALDYGPFPEGQWECPVPDCDSADLKDRTAVQRHTRIVHGVILGELLAGRAPAGEDREERRPTPEMPLRNIPEQGVPMFCPFDDCNLGRGGKPSKNKRSLATHFTQRHGIPIGEWFRDHPEVDPESLLVRDETLV